MKSIILIMQNNLEKAEKILNKGLESYPNNFDLLINLGYLYEQTGKNKKAKVFYLKAQEASKTNSEKKDIKKTLDRLVNSDLENNNNQKSNTSKIYRLENLIINNKLKKPKIFTTINKGNISEKTITRNWKNRKPLVSINCIAYNHEKFIRDAINSFLMQKTTFPFEIIIHDDASTDDTPNIVRKYKSKFPNIIKVILQDKNIYSQNQKPFKMTKSISNGKYIAICEGDDFWLDPYKLQKQVDFLEKNQEFVISGHDAVIINENYKLISKSKLPNNQKKDFNSDDLIKRKAWVLTMNMVFKNVLKNLPNEFNMVLNGDNFLISLLGHYGKSKYHNNIIPSVYRLNKGGVWSSLNKEEKLDQLINTRFWIYKYYNRIGNIKYKNYFWKKFIYSVKKRQEIFKNEM